MFYSNAHTHSTFCDGKATLAEMAQAASAKGFTDLGFTSHSYAPFDPGCIGVADESSYQQAVRQLAAEKKDQLTISLGLEWDLFSPRPQPGYDYLIGSVHYFRPRAGSYRSVDESPETFSKTLSEWFANDALQMAAEYYELVVQHITENRPQIVGHFDLITKFNERLHYLDEKDPAYQRLALQALRQIIPALKENGGLVEVNTGAVSRGYRQTAYPADFLLQELLAEEVPVIITSDSHETGTLDYGFQAAENRLRQLGFRESWQLRSGRFVAVPL